MPTQTDQEIIELPVTGMPGRTPRNEIEKPKTERGKEPIVLCDWSGSENEQASPDSPKTKRELIQEIMPVLARELAKEDSEGANEEGGGGLRTFLFDIPDEIVFEEGEEVSNDPRDLGDVNEANVLEKFGGLYKPQYQTFGMPAIRASEYAYQTEYGNRLMRSRPAMEVIIITDGKLNDAAEFESWVAQADELCVICVAIIGYGAGHDQAVNHYRQIAENNKYVSVVALTGVSDPAEIALDIKLMAM